MSLSEEDFRRRHLLLTLVLLCHVPALFAYGYLVGGFDVTPLAIEVAFPLVAAVLGALPTVRRRIRMFAVTTGLIYSSVALLHLSAGAAEASLHFLVVLAVVFLYREWFLFVWSILLMGFSYQLLAITEGVLGVGVEPAAPEMALWALLAAGGVASIGMIAAWRSAQDSHEAVVAALESARERDEAAARRDAYGKMYVNLARRSQSLVDRQLTVIDQLEDDVDDPDVLAAVFELDHLTTRIRRHGESLLVVADVDLPARATEPVSLTDVVRGAQSEIEQYRRVDAGIDPSITIKPGAARDLVHLLAELLDNATTYSPPNSMVKVHAHAGDAGAVVLTVEDRGLGLTPDRLAQANRDLQDTDALDENAVRHLGFRVMARLAEKHGVTVRLTSTNGGGVTAWVELPASVIASSDPSNLSPARLPDVPVAGEEPATAEPPSLPQRGTPVDAPPPTAPPGPPPAGAPEPGPADTPELPPAATAPQPPPAATQPAPPSGPESPASPPADPPAPTPAVPPAPVPAPVPVGFSANGRSRRSRRGRSPVNGSHGRTTSLPPPELAEAPPPSMPSAPPSGSDTTPSPEPQEPTTRPAAEAPPLPRRERGASVAEEPAEPGLPDEAMDLFAGYDDGAAGRASLGDFQRGQESARREARG